MSFFKNIFSKKEVPVKSYEDFWLWFQKNEKTFFEVLKNKGDVEKVFFIKLSPKLNQVKEGIYYLAGMFNDSIAELVFSAEGEIKNMVFVEEFVLHAPCIDGWLFTPLKPALDIANVNIDMAGYRFNRENISFYANDLIEYPDEIDITVVYSDYNEADKTTTTNGTFIFLDNFLGELNFAASIDNIKVIGKQDAQKELVPIEKLKDYLAWREKEFIEKYEGVRNSTENGTYSMFKAELKSGNALLAVINTDLLNWDRKASHPWIAKIEIRYDGEKNRGMPDKGTYNLLNEMEDEISGQLIDYEGYLNIGRQTAEGVREIYFACKEFRKPSRILFEIENKYKNKLDIRYSIYKDKYWRSFNRFINNG